MLKVKVGSVFFITRWSVVGVFVLVRNSGNVAIVMLKLRTSIVLHPEGVSRVCGSMRCGSPEPWERVVS
jgi:hypothetical protein